LDGYDYNVIVTELICRYEIYNKT